ncbi:hypothetical protein FACS1894116_09240 [Betaproteobacteria bacterium]|nr:hypothetical protein FACS1894116_09240 [Betaproteobacteria bacterium]GHU00718.1 hypothetical protein FACS1894154_10140 [Betaproteobacteria bacterium]GHU09643.1 hypothetical protein AGMMS50225_10980 [Betaproteobacteria bacterium]GHU24493.1 hypothetical protein FACS189488_09260 [Betaproteobacteria bacterium]GHU30089.1 hypothetical protein FACS189497_09270 [Betaproteobacteria bacterium]
MTTPTLDAARASGIASVGTIDVNRLGGGSLQLMFAKLQLTLAESAKNSAMSYIGDIQKAQEEQKQVAAFLATARKQQQSSKDINDTTSIPADMAAYMDTNKLVRTDNKGSGVYTKDQWDVAIESLKGRSEALGADTQQKMVFVQDFMGQYNSYLQGSNSVIQQSNQTLAELARAR